MGAERVGPVVPNAPTKAHAYAYAGNLSGEGECNRQLLRHGRLRSSPLWKKEAGSPATLCVYFLIMDLSRLEVPAICGCRVGATITGKPPLPCPQGAFHSFNYALLAWARPRIIATLALPLASATKVVFHFVPLA